MSEFTQKVTDAVNSHDQQVDQGLDKAGQAADQRTGGQHTDQIDKAVDAAQQHTGSGDSA